MKKDHTAEQGQVMVVVTVLFSAVALAIVTSVMTPLMREVRIGSDLLLSKQSYFTAEAGSEDAFYRVKNVQTVSFPYTLSLASSTATMSSEMTGVTEQLIIAKGNANDLIRTVVKELTITDGYSFSYAVQTGRGGFFLYNNSTINGSIYANGPVVGGNSNANSYNIIHGGIVSAGPTGSVDHVRSTSTVYSHFIHHATIDGDAHYQSFNGASSTVTVAGTRFPDASDQPTTTFPISDALISQWEENAASGGSVTCTGDTYTISSSVTIGPKKIPCDLVISGNGTIVTLTGNLLVTGNITMNGTGGSGIQMKVADSVGDKSIAVIADDASDRAESGEVVISGNTNFYGSTGNANSYVLVISQNNGEETGESSDDAIKVVNGAAGNLLIYASHGGIRLQNNVNLRGVTAYKLSLENNTVVNYSIGLAQTLFTSGSGGAWKIKRWQEL